MIDAPLVGFGSGIRWLQFDRQLLDLVDRLPQVNQNPAFIFATSGMPEPPYRHYLRGFAQTLEQKGFRVIGTFHCRGVDTWGPLKLLGGVSKHRPNTVDLQAARDFAAELTG